MITHPGQRGFTLPELLIAVILMGIVAWGIGSAFWIGASTNIEWDGRMEAAGQMRNLQLAMYNDVASAKSVITCNNGGSSATACTSAGTCTSTSPCSGVTIVSCGASVGGGTTYQPTAKTTTYAVGPTTISRSVSGAGTNSVARYVTGGGFYMNGSALVVKAVVTTGSPGLSSFTDGALFQFEPRVNNTSSSYQC